MESVLVWLEREMEWNEYLMVEERRFFTGKITLNVAEIAHAGAPDVIMLLHGGSARWQYLRSVMRDLARDYRIIAPDLRGHGLSENVPGAYRLTDFADDVQRLIESVGRPVTLFGHSLGGNVALMAAARVSERVAALILGDAPFTREGGKPLSAQHERMVMEWARMAGGAKAAIVGQLKAMLVAPEDGTPERSAVDVIGEDSPWFDDMAESLANHDPTFPDMVVTRGEDVHHGFNAEDLLPLIKCPTLLLQADPARGGLMTDEQVELGKRYLPQVAHVRLSGTGHALFVDNQETVLQVVRDFLKKSVRR